MALGCEQAAELEHRRRHRRGIAHHLHAPGASGLKGVQRQHGQHRLQHLGAVLARHTDQRRPGLTGHPRSWEVGVDHSHVIAMAHAGQLEEQFGRQEGREVFQHE